MNVFSIGIINHTKFSWYYVWKSGKVARRKKEEPQGREPVMLI